MISFAIINEEGVPVRLGRARALPAGAIALPPDLTPEHGAALVYRDGRWQPKPDRARSRTAPALAPAELQLDVLPRREVARQARARAFAAETDPMVGQVMRGEITLADYQAAVAAIRVRFPYPED